MGGVRPTGRPRRPRKASVPNATPPRLGKEGRPARPPSLVRGTPAPGRPPPYTAGVPPTLPRPLAAGALLAVLLAAAAAWLHRRRPAPVTGTWQPLGD